MMKIYFSYSTLCTKNSPPLHGFFSEFYLHYPSLRSLNRASVFAKLFSLAREYLCMHASYAIMSNKTQQMVWKNSAFKSSGIHSSSCEQFSIIFKLECFIIDTCTNMTLILIHIEAASCGLLEIQLRANDFYILKEF